MRAIRRENDAVDLITRALQYHRIKDVHLWVELARFRASALQVTECGRILHYIVFYRNLVSNVSERVAVEWAIVAEKSRS